MTDDTLTCVEEPWPWPLERAAAGSGLYVAELRSGLVLRFTSAHPGDEAAFVTLAGVTIVSGAPGAHRHAPFAKDAFPNGLCVRVADIVWVADVTVAAP